MSRRTIQSPGVEIREIDQTLRAPANVGTTVFIPGFSNEGPTDEILNVGTFADFEQIYGKPTTAAERYFYHSVRQVFNSDANVYVSRLPYGNGNGLETQKYTAQVYPVVSPQTVAVSAITSDSNGTSLSFDNTLGDPVQAGVTGATVYLEGVFKATNGELSYISTSVADLSSLAGTSTITLSTSATNADLASVEEKDIISAQVYSTEVSGASGFSTENLSGSEYYILGQPTLVELTETQYNQVANGEFTWSNDVSAGRNTLYTGSNILTGAGIGIVVLNTGKTSVNEKYEGYYATIIDNTDFNPATDFDGVRSQYTMTSTGTKAPSAYTTVPTSRLDYALSATNLSETRNVSRSIEDVPEFNINGPEYVDTVSFGLIKSRITPFASDDLKLSYFLAEGYTGSLNYYRTIQNENGSGNKSFFLEASDDRSPNVKIFVNPNISRNDGDWTSGVGDAPTKFVRTAKSSNSNASIVNEVMGDGGLLNTQKNYNNTPGIYPFGTFVDTGTITTGKNLGSIYDKLDRVFRIASNVELFNIDISIEAGLGTIAANRKYSSDTSLTAASGFEDTAFLNIGNITTGDGFYSTSQNLVGDNFVGIRDEYRNIYNIFEQFARQTRKDHIFIADILRNIVVQGDNAKALDDKNKNFSKHVYWPLRHQFGIANSNYACVFANWAKVYDVTSDKNIWIPFSGVAASNFARTDANFAPWFAPAGFTRGVVTGVTDIAISPTQRQRDQLYRVALNPVTQFPNEGVVIFGQKTLQKKPTAFDRINVRRLFLDLEKRTKRVMKYFIFEPNTFLTRTKIVNTLSPIFENAKQTEGLYDYLIVCDERNNTTDRINNNELVVDIYLKPVRAAEFILVNFYAVNNDVNFEEIVGQ